MLHHCITCQIYSSLLFVEKCQRASTFRLSPPSRRQQWHCRSSPTSNCGASACQATILKHISGNSLCKPTFTLGIHGGRHQLCSDLHPIAFLTIMSFPLCIFFFFTWCFWAVPTLVLGSSHAALDHPSLEQGDSFTAKEDRSYAREVVISEIKELQITTATSPLCITSCALHHSNTLLSLTLTGLFDINANNS